MQEIHVPDPLHRKAEEFQQRVDSINLEFQQSLEKTKSEIEQFHRSSSRPPTEKNVWPIVTLAATICLGLSIWVLREHRTKRRRQHVENQAATVVALVWDEIDPDEIRRVIDEFQIDRADVETFRTAMMKNALGLPLPWYRLDIPGLLEAIGRYVAGQPWTVKAEGDSTDQNRGESFRFAQASPDAARDSLRPAPATAGNPNQLEVICPNGHTFAVQAIYAGAHRKCPQCGSLAIARSE